MAEASGNEAIVIMMIRSALALGMHPDTVRENFGVSKTYLRKKCGWKPGRTREWM